MLKQKSLILINCQVSKKSKSKPKLFLKAHWAYVRREVVRNKQL